jgi:hypothetical protein
VVDVLAVTTTEADEQGALGQLMKASSWQQWLLRRMLSPVQKSDTAFQNCGKSPCGSFSL